MKFSFEKELEKIRALPEPQFGIGQTVQKDGMVVLWRITRVRPKTWLSGWIFYDYDLESMAGEQYHGVSEIRLKPVSSRILYLVDVLHNKKPPTITTPIKRTLRLV